jgi:mono/diheme cytochrome c family protein
MKRKTNGEHNGGQNSGHSNGHYLGQKSAFMSGSMSVFVSVAMSALLSAVSGCSWFTDFKQQPKIDPWESVADSIPPRANPQHSVPIYGSSAPGFAYGRMASIATVDSMSSITNPVASDERSLRNGRMQYAINCSTCHGERGAGDGPVTKFGFPPIVIGAGSNAATRLSDGYIFGIIRNGRGLMPPYNRIEEHDRWDLINYLRALQGGVAVESGPLARPGITGDKMPGANTVAPTRPAPYYRPAVPTTTTPAPAPAPNHP